MKQQYITPQMNIYDVELEGIIAFSQSTEDLRENEFNVGEIARTSGHRRTGENLWDENE